MKKTLQFILGIFPLIILQGCNDLHLTTQTIQSAIDCIESERWSWNNGVAVSDTRVEYGDRTFSEFTAHFSFKSKLAGTLKFSYSLEDRSKSDIEVKVDGKSVFHEKYKSEEPYPTEVVVTNIPKNKVVEFSGMYCTVSNVMITVVDNNSENNPDFPDDF